MRTSTRQAQWVLRAQSDDREALELLLGSIQAPLRTYLSGVVGQTDADDVLQQVLISIYRKLVWLENPELFRPWAYRIASRAAYRWLKRRHRWHQADEPALDSNSMPEAPSESLLQQLPHIEGISPASRAVLVLHFTEDLPLADVAAILKLPVGTVKSRLAYGLAALRRRVGGMRRL